MNTSNPVVCFYDLLDVLIICREACLNGSFIFCLIVLTRLSSAVKVNAMINTAALACVTTIILVCENQETKGERDHSDFVRVKCPFEGLMDKNKHIVINVLLSSEMI